MTREKGYTLGYWIGVVVGTIAILGFVGSLITRVNALETSHRQIPGIEWDMRVNKGMWAKLYPDVYDEVITNEVRVNGQRPKE